MDQDRPERSAGCEPRPLAQSAVGQVLVCEHCRQMHLQVGPLTLRLTHDAFADLTALLQSAQRAGQAQMQARMHALAEGEGAAASAASAASVWH